MDNTKHNNTIKYYREQLNRLYKDTSELADQIWRIQQLLILEELELEIEMSGITPAKSILLRKWIKDKKDLIS